MTFLLFQVSFDKRTQGAYRGYLEIVRVAFSYHKSKMASHTGANYSQYPSFASITCECYKVTILETLEIF